MAAADKTLLDRLNALKPSGISLSGAPQTAGAAEADTAAALAPNTATAEPATREDALAARLRTLRRGQEDDAQATTPSPRAAGLRGEARKTSPSAGGGGGAAGPLTTGDDDQAVDDLLLALAASGLGDEDATDEEDEGDDGLLPLPDVPTALDDGSSEDDEATNEKKVAELLSKLGGPDAGRAGVAAAGANGDGDDSDDSDGETMRRDVKDVLAQAEAEANLAGQAQKEDKDESPDAAGASAAEPPPDGTAAADGRADDHVLALPAVPTKLVDPPPTADEAAADDPDSSISARLAALRGLHGKAAGLGQTDAFGLPSAPTFQPGEAGAGWRRNADLRYTDADQQTWCIVCLEDATVRCLGCSEDGGGGASNNAYCARCWREMHVGPAAGFDERGHQRVPLVRRQGP